MVAEPLAEKLADAIGCSLAKISMVAERFVPINNCGRCCSLAKISMVAEQTFSHFVEYLSCSLAKISMVAEQDL